MKYIHYGSAAFDSTRFTSVRNKEFPFVKPEVGTGLWASPVDAEYGWKEAATDMGFFEDRAGSDKHFIFELAPHTRILTINSLADLMPLPIVISRYATGGEFDFEAIAKEYDVMYLTTQGQTATRMSHPRNLYGWDCECILVLNQGVII